MTTRVHTKLAGTIRVTLVIAAVAASGAVVAQAKGDRVEPSAVVHYTEPGSTGYVPPPTHVNIPAWLTNFREPGSTGWVPTAGAVATTTGAGGLDWTSALIGGGVVLGAGLVSAGALLAVRKRRALAHT